jgi:hypothetical protein
MEQIEKKIIIIKTQSIKETEKKKKNKKEKKNRKEKLVSEAREDAKYNNRYHETKLTLKQAKIADWAKYGDIYGL